MPKSWISDRNLRLSIRLLAKDAFKNTFNVFLISDLSRIKGRREKSRGKLNFYGSFHSWKHVRRVDVQREELR